jgi:hypothetical protein
MKKIFKINFLGDRPQNNFFEAYPLPFKMENYFRSAHYTYFDDPAYLPDGPVYMKVHFNEISPCHLLKNPSSWFLISDLMYKTILSLEHLKHFSWPAILIDTTHKGSYFDENGNLKANLKKDNTFKFFGIHDYFNCFDKEHSEWDPNPYAPPNKISGITKLVLKSQNGYFPPIFRIEEEAYLFITGELKDLLEQNDVHGVEFIEVEVSG